MDLRITDGTTTVTLDGSAEIYTRHGSGYVPETPQRDLSTTRRPDQDGTDYSEIRYENVEERFDAWLVDPTGTLTAALLRAQRQETLTRLFEQARGGEVPVWIEYRPEASEPYYRSALHAGAVTFGRVTHDPGYYDNAILPVEIEWIRAPWWEDVAATTIVTAAAVTNTAASIPVAGGVVAGNQSAPAVILFDNTWVNRVQQIFVSRNEYSSPATYAPALGGASGTVGSSEALLGTIALSSAFLTAAGGRFFRPMGRFTSKVNDTWFRWVIEFQGTPIWRGSLFQTPLGLLAPMGPAIALPPGGPTRGATQHALTLDLYAVSVTGGAVALQTLYMMPVDSWREWWPTGYGLGANATLTDDPLERRLYTANWSGAGESQHYVAYGGPVMLKPNVAQNIRLLWATGTTGLSDPTADAEVTISYHPRRLTL